MRELDECLELSRLIRDKQERIYELKVRISTPKNQILSDMPRGGGCCGNDIENYIVKLEKLEALVKDIQKKLNGKWRYVNTLMQKRNITDCETIMLLSLRFYKGLSWNKCAELMQNRYPTSKWNLNKCFRAYRKVLYKLR